MTRYGRLITRSLSTAAIGAAIIAGGPGDVIINKGSIGGGQGGAGSYGFQFGYGGMGGAGGGGVVLSGAPARLSNSGSIIGGEGGHGGYVYQGAGATGGAPTQRTRKPRGKEGNGRCPTSRH